MHDAVMQSEQFLIAIGPPSSGEIGQHQKAHSPIEEEKIEF